MPDSKVEELNDPNELKSAKEYLLDRYSYDHRISNDDTDHNGHIWAVNTILKHLEKSITNGIKGEVSTRIPQGAKIKTLGDTGLMPARSDRWYDGTTEDAIGLHKNKIIDQISAIPISQIIEKALELGLVRISKCENDDCIEGLVLFDSETGCCVGCTECSGRGFTITEGGQK